MNKGNYVDEYKKNAVNSASPLRLVIMLYDGAIKFINLGRTALVNKDLYNQNLYLQKAQRIITELTSSLDMERGGEVSTNLFALYTYTYNQLVTGNLQDDTVSLDAAEAVLRDLRDGWIQMELQQKQTKIEERLAS